MPNHVSNHIETSKEVLDEILTVDNKGQVEFDFNLLVPMPDSVYRGNVGLAETIRYGANNSLDWGRKHWGTKWGSYSVERVSDTVLTFETAWSHPFPIVEALSKKFSNETIFVAYADEDLGYNLGTYEILDGDVVKEGGIQEDSFEAYCFIAALNGRDKLDYLKEDIEYVEELIKKDKNEDDPGLVYQLEDYRKALAKHENNREFYALTRPDFDFSDLRSYLNV